MTRDEVLAQLEEARVSDNVEYAHELADRVLCELLASLGYEDVVRKFNEIEKWYA